MSQPLKKQQIIALFGEKAGNKLYQLLNPCCPTLEYRVVLECVNISNEYKAKFYVKSSVALSNTILFIINNLSKTTEVTVSVESLPSNEEVLFFEFVGGVNSLLDGTFIQTTFGGKSNIVILELPICTLITLDSVDIPNGTADVSIVNGYQNIIVEYSYDGGVTWDGVFGTEPLGMSPVTGNYQIIGPLLSNIVLRAKVKNSQGEDVYSEILP